MVQKNLVFPNTSDPILSRASVRLASAARGLSKLNIWVGDLPKTGRRSVLFGDALLIHCVCDLVLSPAVRQFTVDWATVRDLAKGDGVSDEGMILVELLGGQKVWHRVYSGRERSNVPEHPERSTNGIPVEVLFVGDPGGWEFRCDNILTLIQLWNAARRSNWTTAYLKLQERLTLTGIVTIEELVSHYPDDRGVALGVVARMLLERVASLELDHELVGLNSILRASQKDEVNRARERSPFVRDESQVAADDEPMSKSKPRRGRPRSLAKPFRSTVGWPAPNISVLTPKKRDEYRNRQTGVELFVAGASPETIKSLSGLTINNVRRYFHRCTAEADEGEIFGYYGLLDNYRVKSYERTAVTNGTEQSGAAGYSGALEQVLTRFNDVAEWLVATIQAEARGEDSIHNSSKALSVELKKKLREKGIGDDEWPFCTENGGEEAIRRYRHELVGPGKSTEGSDAAKQANQFGQGPEVVIRSIRPMSFVQLDYQLIGAHTILKVINKYQKLIKIPLKRWYVGYAGFEYPATVAGIATCYESEPSTDTALETINSLLDPRDDVLYEGRLGLTHDGKFLLRHFLKELAWKGFTVLRLDNAWANQSHDMVHNIMDVTGCFVCFGPPHQWWPRSFIESLIHRVNARGLARVPSTAGTGPSDPKKKKKPGAVASRMEFGRDDAESIIYGAASDFNTSSANNLQGSSPIDAVASYIRTGMNGFFLRPLPRDTQDNSTIVYHRLETTVQVERRGGHPYLKINGRRFTGMLSAARRFIHKKVVVFLLRCDARFGKVYAMETGEPLGDIRMQGALARTRLSWKDFLLLKRQTAGDRPERDALSQWSEERKAAPKRKAARPASNVLDEGVPDGRSVLREERAAKLAGRSPEPPVAKPSAPPMPKPATHEQDTPEFSDPWGLASVRPTKGVHRA